MLQGLFYWLFLEGVGLPSDLSVSEYVLQLNKPEVQMGLRPSIGNGHNPLECHTS